MRPRVLHLITLLSADGRYGGPQTVARTLATRFGDELWGAAAAADLRAEAARRGERRFRAFCPPGEQYSLLAAPGLWWALWRRLGSSARPDLVHLHAGPELSGLAALLLLAARRAPFVYQAHGMFTYPAASARARVARCVFFPLIRRAAAVVALTGAERDLLIGYGLEPAQITTIANGVELADIAPLPHDGDDPVVAFVGRLHPRKHPERFTAAAVQLARRGVRARFVMAGADQGALGIARAADPDGVVIHVGAVSPDEARRIIASADVVVVCSDVEPFGMVAVEALASATALLITDSCDLAEELRCAHAALLTSPGPAAIADGISRLLAEPGLRTALCRAGHTLVHERYSMQVIASAWERLYRRASTGRVRSPDTDGGS
ncbi:MAG: glycosyltransferase family 4 protein [Jatrophihabitantaceae bacterium]